METRPNTALTDLLYDQKGVRTFDRTVANASTTDPLVVDPFTVVGLDTATGNWVPYTSQSTVGVTLNDEAITLDPETDEVVPVLQGGAVKLDMLANAPGTWVPGVVKGQLFVC